MINFTTLARVWGLGFLVEFWYRVPQEDLHTISIIIIQASNYISSKSFRMPSLGLSYQGIPHFEVTLWEWRFGAS